MPPLPNVVEEEPIVVYIWTHPQEGLPVKEWEVEIEPSRRVSDLKDVIFEEYGVEQELQRLCATAERTDAGVKDDSRVADLPNHPQQKGKQLHMLPRRNKEDALLERILNWAYRAQVIEEYEACGCVYKPQDGEEEEGVASKKKRPSMEDLKQGMRPSALKGKFANWGGSVSKKAKKGAKAKPNLQMDGDKLDMQEPAAPVVERMPFNLACAIIATLNMFIVGWEADYTCWGQGLNNCPIADRTMWFALDAVLALLFTFEMAFRVFSLGPVQYFCGDALVIGGMVKTANIVDFIVVFLRLLDTFIFDLAVGIDTKIKIISCIRIASWARVARLLRLVKSVRELWLIVAGITDLCKTVMWVMILLVVIFWVVGIVMTIIIGHDDGFFNYERSYWGKSAYFDTVPKSVFTLLQLMTMSQWSTIFVRPVFEQFPLVIILIVVPFLMITTVGLLNIIVGVVVETTLLSASNNAEKEAKETSKMHARVMESLKMVFEEADADGGGTLDREELNKILKKPHVRDRLRVLDIPIKDLDQLFCVLDEEGVGEIATEHFFRGCSRLRGPAMACDLHRMSVDFSRYIQLTQDLVDATHSTNDRLRSLLHDMESVDRDIIKGDADDCDPVLGTRRDRSKRKEKQDRKLMIQEEENKRQGSKKSTASTRRPSLLSRTLSTGSVM